MSEANLLEAQKEIDGFVDPPEGFIPNLTPAQQERLNEWVKETNLNDNFDFAKEINAGQDTSRVRTFLQDSLIIWLEDAMLYGERLNKTGTNSDSYDKLITDKANNARSIIQAKDILKGMGVGVPSEEVLEKMRAERYPGPTASQKISSVIGRARRVIGRVRSSRKPDSGIR